MPGMEYRERYTLYPTWELFVRGTLICRGKEMFVADVSGELVHVRQCVLDLFLERSSGATNRPADQANETVDVKEERRALDHAAGC